MLQSGVSEQSSPFIHTVSVPQSRQIEAKRWLTDQGWARASYTPEGWKGVWFYFNSSGKMGFSELGLAIMFKMSGDWPCSK